MDEQAKELSRKEKLKAWKKDARQKAADYLNEKKSAKTRDEKKAVKVKHNADKKDWKAELKGLDKTERKDQKKAYKAFKKRLGRTKRIIAWCLVVALLCGIGYAASPLVHGFSKILSLQYTLDSEISVTAREEGVAISQTIADEGMVLLRNENGALPLTDMKVNVFGTDAYNFRYGGSGSGGVDVSAVKSLFEGLDAAGISYNPQLHQMYLDMGIVRGVSNGLIDSILATFRGAETLDEPDAAYLTDDVIAQAKEYSDRAIIVMANDAVESADANQDALKITQNRRALIDKIATNFDKVTVIINCGNAMELGILNDYDSIDSVIWAGIPGPYGCLSIGKVLAGQVNPSGRLVDTWAYDIGSSPASVNFTTDANEYKYSNSNMAFINYEEGIYVGYRYYETRYVDDEAGYSQAVQFPFGFGLSFTDFTWETESFEADDESITWEVKVTNTGSMAGKDVVELYFSAPYIPGGIEKSAIELAAFAKTGELAPGASETVTLTMATRDLSSYDMSQGAYVLDEGSYAIKLGRSVHDIVETQDYEVAQTVLYDTDEVTGEAITNRFDYANGGLTYLSRNDWEGTWPDDSDASKQLSDETLQAIKEYSTITPSSQAVPVTGANNGLMLADMKGLSYNDASWDAFLDQFTYDELNNIVSWGGWHSEAVERLGVPETNMLDGPAGLNGMYSSFYAAAYPAESVVASTWNADLGYALGEAVAKEAVGDGIQVWYAPAMNLHRTAQGGRNFEYYSEDPVLSGKIAAATIRGAQDQGVVVTIKHFVLNNEETNARSGIYAWLNEQALRELYLRPFEIAVKEGGAHGAMSAFTHIGYKWSGANSELLQDVLRGEWGFEGFVSTDAQLGGFMDPNLGIRSGNDLMLSMGLVNSEKMINTEYKNDPAGTLIALRSSVHNLLYALVNYTNIA